MIKLRTLDKREIFLNVEIIEQLESVPETMITLTNGKKLLVINDPQEIIKMVIEFRKNIFNGVTGVRTFEVK